MGIATRKLFIISDFDGTITQEVGTRYEVTFTEELARRLTLSPTYCAKLLEEAIALVKSDSKYGWEMGGYVVAPATSDRFLLTSASARILVRNAKQTTQGSHIPDSLNVDALISEVYTTCYPFAETEFRAGAKEFIERFNASGQFAIVTNSKTDHVENKLSELLGSDNDVLVVGNAKKFEVFPTSEETQIEGLNRPVYFDRRIYHELIDSLIPEGNLGVVIGDVAELDLFGPLNWGLYGILLNGPNTPVWEIQYVKNHPHGFVVETLEEATSEITKLLHH